MSNRKKRLEWHEEAIREMAESLLWYAERSPRAAQRMRREIEKAALSLVGSPIALSGRPGAVIGTRELPVGHHVPFTLIFTRDAASGHCTIYRCFHQSRRYPSEDTDECAEDSEA